MWFDASGSLDVLATLATNTSCLGNANTKKRPSDRLLGGFDGYVREVEGKPYELTEGTARRAARAARRAPANAARGRGVADPRLTGRLPTAHRHPPHPGAPGLRLGRGHGHGCGWGDDFGYGLAPRAFSMSVIRSISDCWASTMPCASRFSTPTVHWCTHPSAMWMPPL